jgi:hypothetical protein
MLAQTFLTAEELRINERLYKALVEVYWLLVDETIPERLFDMSVVGHPKIKDGHVCGTAGCLLGWSLAVDKDCVQLNGWGRPIGMTTAFRTLCFNATAIYQSPPRGQAAQALHNYLTTGRANWREALKG